MANYRELQDMNERLQTGMQPETDNEFSNILGNVLSNRRSVAEETAQMNAENAAYFNDNTRRAIEAGFGSRHVDRNVNVDEFLADPENARAHAQSGLSQLINGTAKMGTTAALTFVDDTVGTIAGIGNVAKDLVDGDGEFHPLNSFINNGVSRNLDELRDWFETVFPNYRTNEERDDIWWQHLNANFFGDTLIKNFGFTIGSVASMGAVSAGIGKIAAKRLAPDILKGAMAAAKGDANAAKELGVLADMFKTGEIDVKVLASNAKKAAKRLAYHPATVQFTSALLGSIGESRIEALGAAKELAEELTNYAADMYDQRLGSIDDTILAEHPELRSEYDYEPEYDEYGNMSFKLKPFGPNALAMRQALLDKYDNEYNENIAFIDKQAQNAAAGTYLANLPVLTVSSMVQFGKMLSGGYKNAVVKNSIKGGINIGENGAISAAYREGMGAGARTALGSAKVALSEGGEELMQKFISETEKYKGRKNLAAFNNDAYDDDAIDTFGEGLSAFFSTVKDQVKDPDTWQEFAVGAITGLIGLPGIKRTVDADGKTHRSLSFSEWNGGFIGEYNDNKKKSAVVREAVKAMNDRVNSKDFTDNWHSIIRHSLYGKQAEEAAAKKDEFAWHTADDKMLINDVLLFARNGRIDDLLDIADSFAKMDESEADDIKSLIQTAAEEDSPYINMSDKEIVDPVKKRAEQVKNVINDYKRIFNDLVIRRPEISDKFAEEILFTEMQMARFEARYQDIAGSSKDKLKNAIENMKAFVEVDKDGKKEIIKDEDKVNKKKEVLLGHLESLFGYNVDRWNQIVKELTDAQLQSYAEELSAFAVDDAEKKKVKDLAKLSISRSNFYDRLRLLNETTQKDFDNKAETHEKHNEKRKDSFTQEVGKNAKSREEAISIINQLEKAQGKDRAREVLSRVAEDNPFINTELTRRKYLDQVRGNIPSGMNDVSDIVDEMFDFIKDKDLPIDEIGNGTFTAEQYAALGSAFAPNPEDVITPEEAIANINKALGLVRDAIQKSDKDNSGTGSPNGVSAAEQARRKNATPVSDIKKGEKKVSEQEPVGTDGIQANPPIDLQSYNDSLFAGLDRIPDEAGYNPFDPNSTMSDGQASLDIEDITEDDTIADQKAAVVEAMEDTEEVEDALNVDVDNVENDNNVKYPFLQPAFGQFAADDARAIREGDIVELKPFGESNPEYADMYNALANTGAFEYVNSGNIKKGDNIYFKVDPSFPKYIDNDGYEHTPILMVHRKNGKDQIVGIVPSRDRSRYENIDDLYEALDKEYSKFLENEDNSDKVFEFSKVSTVKKLRKGLHTFSHELEGKTLNNDMPIIHCGDYEQYKDSPIVFRFPNDRLDMIEIGHKKGVKSAIVKELESYEGFMAKQTKQTDKTDETDNTDDKKPYKGGLYFLTRNVYGKLFPVRLSVARYNESTEDGSYLDATVKGIIRKLFDVNENGDVALFSKESNKAVKDELRSLLAVNDLTFHVVEEEGNTLIHINTTRTIKENGEKVNKATTISKIYYREGHEDQLTNTICNVIKRLNRGININPRMEREVLDGFIKNGLVMSNVQYLSQVGANFYVNEFNSETGEFETNQKDDETDDAQGIDLSADELNVEDVKPADNIRIPEDEDGDESEYESTGERDEDENEDDDEYEGEDEEFSPPADINYDELTFSDLDDEAKQAIMEKGYSREEFDSMDAVTKEHALQCANIN